MLALVLTIPGLVVGTFYAGIISTVLFWTLVYKFTDADGFADVILLIIVMNVTSFMAGMYLFKRSADFMKMNPPSVQMANEPVTTTNISVQPSGYKAESVDRRRRRCILDPKRKESQKEKLLMRARKGSLRKSLKITTISRNTVGCSARGAWYLPFLRIRLDLLRALIRHDTQWFILSR